MSNYPTDSKPVNAETVATHFGVTVPTVNRWVRERRIPFVRISRRVVRFRIDEVESVLRQDAGAIVHA